MCLLSEIIKALRCDVDFVYKNQYDSGGYLTVLASGEGEIGTAFSDFNSFSNDRHPVLYEGVQSSDICC